MFVLELLGTLLLRSETHPVPAAAQRKRPLGLLAVLGLAGANGVSRDRLEAYFWPESSADSARHALDQTVYAIRHALGSDVILSTARAFRLNPDLVTVDTWEFEEAIRDREWATAIVHYRGPLLDGAHFSDSSELEALIAGERERFRSGFQSAAEHLADACAEQGDHSASVNWLRRLVASDPLSARAATKLMSGLAAAGDRAGAVKHARLYQALVRQQLEMEPDGDVDRLAASLSGPASPPSSFPRANATNADIAAPETGHVVSSAIPARASEDVGPVVSRLTASSGRSVRLAALLASAVLVALIGAVTVEARYRQAIRPTASLVRNATALPLSDARVAYRHAVEAWTDGTKSGLDTAVVYLASATRMNPDYAEAYAGLADAYAMLAYFGYRPSAAMLPLAKRAALRSLELDGGLASAHPALAYALTWEHDFTGANAEFRKAIAFDPTGATAQASAVDPTYAPAHQWYSILLMILAQKPETMPIVRHPVIEDPFTLQAPVIEISFTKWISAYPKLSGFTSFGPGTIGGEVLSAIDDGTFTHMVARYEITDPETARSFKAVIQGKANDATGEYDMSGIVTWGWMTGAHVHATFFRITPCEFGDRNICFTGKIELQRS